jgi:chromosomal replication initiator protein
MPDISWDNVLIKLKNHVGERLFSTWLAPTSLQGVDEIEGKKTFRIGVPGPMYKESISSNFMHELESAIATEQPGPFSIELVVNNLPKGDDDLPLYDEAAFEQNAGNPILPGQADPQALASRSAQEAKIRRDFLNPDYTFGTFVVGQGNQVAHAACHSVSENPGKA